MRLVRPLLPVFLLVSLLSFAADLRLRVTDPQGAAISGARVSIYHAGSSRSVAVLATKPDGTLELGDLASGNYRLHILAPGFAEASRDVTVPTDQQITIPLSLATVPQTVAVTGTATPIPVEQSGLAISTLEQPALQALNQPDAGDTLRFVPGAIVSDSGRYGGLTTLFVRGGESRYNKVIVDGVPVNEAGGVFDFSVVPMIGVERLELLRGAASTLYGSDAMTSVVQLWSTTGTTPVPEFRFGADSGTFSTAHGYASLAGARGRFDYNLFGDQFNTDGQGINDTFSNSSQGANLGARITDGINFRFHARHSNTRSGVPNNWWFNGAAPIPPDSDQYARQNNFLASSALDVATGAHWLHHFSAFEYNHVRRNVDTFADPGRPFDDPFDSLASFNRAGFNYQSEYAPREWSRSTFGYHFEDENGFDDSTFVSFGFAGATHTHGLRRNQAIYGEQFFNWKRISILGGIRYEHNESFGDKVVPRANLTLLALRGGQILSGTRLRFGYAQGIQEPTFEESFGVTGSLITVANPNLRREQTRSLEAGFEQKFFGGNYSLSATYFNNRFTDQIQFSFAPIVQYININTALAHGAELELSGRITRHLTLDGGYVYTASQALETPLCAPGSGCTSAGDPLLHRPRHAGNLLLTYASTRFGGSLGGTFIGRRPDSDFFFGAIPPVNYAAGYERVDLGAWYAVNRYVTAYANVGNALNDHYNDVVGYPGLRANFRAGLRFRVGGE